jgi:CRISPR/Cas system-associated exonuclease Cas4 (RecB family)
VLDIEVKFKHVAHDFPTLLREQSEGGRFYVTPDGKKYPSVTTVLADYGKESIMQWRKRVGEKEANRVSKQATTRGTSVHKLVENYLNNLPVYDEDTMPNAKSVFVAMKSALDKINNIHCLETFLFSHELGLAGQVDCIAEFDGKLSVIDFKTSRRLKKKADIANYFMQTSAYAQMFEERTGLKIEQTVIIIGGDFGNFPQVMKEDPMTHREKLISYINKFKEK